MNAGLLEGKVVIKANKTCLCPLASVGHATRKSLIITAV